MDIEDSYDRLQLVCDWGLVVVVVVRLEFMGLHGFGLMATEPNLVLLLSFKWRSTKWINYFLSIIARKRIRNLDIFVLRQFHYITCVIGAYLWFLYFCSSNSPPVFTIRKSYSISEGCVINFVCDEKWKIELNKVSCAIDGLWTEYNDGTWPACCSGKAFDEREVCLLIVFSCLFSMREQPGMW